MQVSFWLATTFFKHDVHRISNFDPVYSENDSAVLNLINQGDALLGSVSILKLALTYCLPYAVCTFGAVSHQQRTPDHPVITILKIRSDRC